MPKSNHDLLGADLWASGKGKRNMIILNKGESITH